ncbi:MAG TPA: HEAT repeat domain-containing protein [Verrucomicrobiae bacterium]|nr:HEAT repeat domain-containing protein [Verrucomicrobiae bacterium]
MFPIPQSLIRCAAIAALAAVALIQPQARAQSGAKPVESESKLIEVLRSDAPAADKAITCKKLAVFGSAEAVPALAPLLTNEELASWARIALEAIPGEAADEALRLALQRAHGRLLVGTINSIGVRRDAKAVGELALNLKNNDAEVASAAAVALGKIGGAQAAAALKTALSTSSDAVRTAVAEGCVRCAEHFLADGQAPAAVELYDAVRKAPVPKQDQLEAIRGAILARKNEGIPLLIEQLRSNDKALFQIGLRTARELPGSQATEAVVGEMHRATQDRQPLLLLALADRGDDQAMPAILESAKTGPKKLRLVAVGILDRMGKQSTAPALIQVASENDAELTQDALVALTRMPGNELDSRVLEHLGQATGRTRQVLVELSARRHIDGALPLLVKATQDPDAGVRAAAVQAVGSIGGVNQVNDLVQLLSTAHDEKQRQDVEEALMAISARLGNGCVQSLLPLAHNQDMAVRKLALHALASAGGSEALKAVVIGIEDREPSVKDEAVRILSTWPNTWPEDESASVPLLNVAKYSKNPTYQVLAMRGYLQFLQGDKKLSNDEKLAKIQQALPLMSRPEEKRSAIAIVQSVHNPAALETLETFTSDAALKEDACSAIVEMAGKNVPGLSPDARRQALQGAIDKSSNEETQRKARAALAKIR